MLIKEFITIFSQWGLLTIIHLLVANTTGAPVPAVPSDMWLPGIFPAGTPILNAKQATVANQRDQQGKPPVMQDLSLSGAQIDMADEFHVPYVSNFALEDPDEKVEGEKESETQTVPSRQDGRQPKVSLDRTIASNMQRTTEQPRLLYGYGASSAVALVPVVHQVHQPQALVPVAVPVIQHSLTPQMQIPRSNVQSSSAVQPTITHSQQTISIGSSVQTLPQAQSQQPQQSRMALPQVAQPVQPITQPQPILQPQPVLQPQPPVVEQPSASLPGQGRFELPTSNGAGLQINQQPQTVQTQPVQQGQQQQSSSITVKHQIVPQHIHIVLPKRKYGYGSYRGY